MRFRKLEVRERKPPAAAQRARSEEQRRSRRRLLYLLLLIGVLVLTLAWFTWQQRWVVTKGRIVAATVAVAPTLTGRISEIRVATGDTVETGQVLAVLERRGLEAELAEVRLELDALRGRLAHERAAGVAPVYAARVQQAINDRAALEAQRAETLARVQAVQGELGLASALRGRLEALHAEQAATQVELERAAAEEQRLRARRAALRSVLELQQRQIASATGLVEAARAELERQVQAHAEAIEQLLWQVAQAEERVARIQSRLDATEIRAPTGGAVRWIHRRSGEVVDHDDTVLSLSDARQKWIVAYVEAADLAAVSKGAPVEVRVEGVGADWQPGFVLDYRSRFEDTGDGPRIGLDALRTPLRLGRVVHPVRIRLDGPWPDGADEEMVVSVRFRR